MPNFSAAFSFSLLASVSFPAAIAAFAVDKPSHGFNFSSFFKLARILLAGKSLAAVWASPAAAFSSFDLRVSIRSARMLAIFFLKADEFVADA